MTRPEIRRIALNRISDKWGNVILTTLIASVAGALVTGSTSFNFNFNVGSSNTTNIPFENSEATTTFFVIFAITFLAIMAFSVAMSLLLSNVVRVGYCKYLLNIVDKKEYATNDLTYAFKDYKKSVVVGLYRDVLIFLWSLLFIIPGIIATYDYILTPFIYADHPEYTPKECLAKSKEMMYGHRWELFCLLLSFIGWVLLTLLTCGIGGLWLSPYENTAVAVFYRQLNGELIEQQPEIATPAEPCETEETCE